MKNIIMTIMVVLVSFASASGAHLYVEDEGNITFSSLTAVNGYGSEVSNAIDIYLEESVLFSPTVAAVGFDAFPADTSFKFRFGIIPVSVYTCTSADWDEILGIEVVYTSGTAGKAYTVNQGVLDTDNAVTITDLLGGVDSAANLGELLAGKNSLAVFTKMGDVDADGYIQLDLGYPSTSPTDPQEFTPDDWDGQCYLIAQVSDPNLTGYSMSGSGFIAQVPEPATVCLVAIGGFGCLRRRLH